MSGAFDDALYLAAGGYRRESGANRFPSERVIARVKGEVIGFLDVLEDQEISVRELLEQLRDG